MIDITFDAKENILYLNYEGTIKYSDYPVLLDKLNIMKDQYELPKVLLILSDYTNATINMGIEDLPKLFAVMQKYFNLFENIYEAFIHVNPLETALSVIAKEQANHQSKYVSEVFSTREMAIAWLKKH